MSVSELLPEEYDERPEQLQLAEEVRDSLLRGETYLAHAPCGLGKSLASLMASKPLLDEDKRLFVTYRTRSQLDIYLKELQRLDPSLVAVSTISKEAMCTHLDEGYSDFGKTCSKLMRNTEQGKEPKCPAYEKVVDDPEGCREEALAACRDFKTPAEFTEHAEGKGFCPYEAMRLLMPEADVFLGTYHYLFEPNIRSQTLNSLEADLDDLVVVADEAHNVPEFARELMSTSWTGRSLDRALTEADQHSMRDAEDILQGLDDLLIHYRKTLDDRESRMIEPGDVTDVLPVSLSSAIKILRESGEVVWQRNFEEKGRGFSSIGRTGDFLAAFCNHTSPQFSHWAFLDGAAGLELSSLDGRELTDPVISRSYASVLMSGTLSPVRVYHGLTTSERAVTREHPSPFPRENRRILVARDVSSKAKERTEKGMTRMAEHVEAVARENEGNVAVFATSYKMMNRLEKRVSTDRAVIKEERGGDVEPIVRELKSRTEGLLFGVMGGKLSEGIDYEGDTLTGLVAAGFPYPPWSDKRRALIEYLDDRFDGKGRLYGYLVPAITRLLQTCGRVHRSAEDRGPIVILDRRVTQNYVSRHLPRDFKEDMQAVDEPWGTARGVKAFWKGR